jgi:hypothetical protein
MAFFLAQELAVNRPELSVTFEHVEFPGSDVKGAVQNLKLDPVIEEAYMRRDELHDAMEDDAQAECEKSQGRVSRLSTPRLPPSTLFDKSTSTMSNLAPFVATVLYDKVLAETTQEVDHLREQLQKARAVQIVSASGTVYAEGQFEDGAYRSNPHLWFVNFSKQFASCALSDLTNVQICIGGICNAHFGTDRIITGIVERDEVGTYRDGWGRIQFIVVDMVSIFVRVGPFPSKEAFLSQIYRDNEINPQDMVSFLAQEPAVNHPELSVKFEVVDLSQSDVKGAIQNLNLDPAIEVAVQRRMEQLREMVEEGVQRRQRIRAAAAAALENGIEDVTGGIGDL